MKKYGSDPTTKSQKTSTKDVKAIIKQANSETKKKESDGERS